MTAPVVNCSTCARPYRHTPEFFYLYVKQNRLGLACLTCHRTAVARCKTRYRARNSVPGANPYTPLRDKWCAGCKRYYRTIPENFNRNVCTFDGLQCRCKGCERADQAAVAAANRKRNAAINPHVDPTKKQCAACHTRRVRVEFHRDSSRTDGLYPRCKSCRYPAPRRTV